MALIVPSAGPGLTTYRVDDSVTGFLHYSSGWGRAGSSSEYNSTTHFASNGGNSLSFSFDGSNVAIVGTIPTGSSVSSSYSIDGGLVIAYSSPIVANTTYSVTFFDSGTLPNDSHTVSVIYTGGNTYFLDYIEYSVPIAGSSPSPSSTLSNQKPSETTTSASSSAQNRSAVIGGVTAAVVVILIIAAILVFLWHRRRTKYSNTRETGPIVLDGEFSPIAGPSISIPGSLPTTTHSGGKRLYGQRPAGGSTGESTYTSANDRPGTRGDDPPPAY
ncbi:hypothetical protein C8J56DRAFT_922276, partial [Mycena floridula]